MIKNPNALKFIHLTDPHVAGQEALVYGRRPTERLRAAIDSINMDHDNADFVVITGDLTHHGDMDAYEVFARELRRLSVPSHLLVGNHDDARAFAYQFPETQRCEHGFIQGSKRTPFGLCLFLDTSEKGTSKGVYCEKRRTWLANALEETDGPVMLFMHHPPFAIGIPNTDDSKLQDSEAFWHVLAPHKQRIRHIFVGHAHRVMFGNWRGISVSGMRGLNHQVMLELNRQQAGQSGNFEAPAYGIVLADADQVMVHMHDFTDRSDPFPL
ncbi:phosphodiesterase [Cohaesibacter sp. CAU 1516]|uniref:phosphodiesterase n=1 Tax=Cohaesibacter sp. CAU 1516 TaxID=2576038 RepID=UPI001AED97B2|nr:phosphodiesterase [Cohaesibacter sp. CAU 1516]